MPLPRDDKLEQSLQHDKAKIRKAEMFRRCLTAKGFERYVESFYRTVEGVSADVRTTFAEAPVEAVGTFWKYGEKVSILVQCRHGGGATSDDGRRFVEKAEIAEFVSLVSDVRKNAEHPVHLICATSVWFAKEARDLCESHRVAAIDFSGLLKMDQAYPLEKFIKETAESDNLKECFSMFWLAKYLPEYAKTEAAAKRTLLDSKSALGALMADVEKTVSETYINPFDKSPEKIESFATILEIPRENSAPEPYVPASIFTVDKTEPKAPFPAFKIAMGGLAVCSLAFYVSFSAPSGPQGLSASAVQSRDGSALSGSTSSGSTGSVSPARTSSERREEARKRAVKNAER